MEGLPMLNVISDSSMDLSRLVAPGTKLKRQQKAVQVNALLN